MKRILFVLIALGLLFSYPISYYLSSETIDITVKSVDKESIVKDGHSSSKYMVYTEDEVFQNVDSWLYFKFNSSDVQNDLMTPKTYTVKVAGWRFRLFSSYRNIVSVQ